MRFVYDHDLHIHSWISDCSRDPEQTPERILQYAKENGLKKICLTDHYWDETVPGASDWYKMQNTAWIDRARPLPQAEGIQFLFGAETDMSMDGVIGVAPRSIAALDFIIVPTTHLHMDGFTCRGDESPREYAEAYVRRFEQLLDADLPFHKVGIAHMTCSLLAYKANYLEVLDMVSDETYRRLLRRAADCGLGIELNFAAIRDGKPITWESHGSELRPYKIAQECGCTFYFGSDAHHPNTLDGEKANAETIIDLLDLKEEQKFAFAKTNG